MSDLQTPIGVALVDTGFADDTCLIMLELTERIIETSQKWIRRNKILHTAEVLYSQLSC